MKRLLKSLKIEYSAFNESHIDFWFFYLKALLNKEKIIVDDKGYMIINKGHLVRFGIKKQSQGNGHGTKMMEDNKKDIVFLKARVWDKKVLEFYRKFSWLKEYKTEKGYNLFVKT